MEFKKMTDEMDKDRMYLADKLMNKMVKWNYTSDYTEGFCSGYVVNLSDIEVDWFGKQDFSRLSLKDYKFVFE